MGCFLARSSNTQLRYKNGWVYPIPVTFFPNIVRSKYVNHVDHRKIIFARYLSYHKESD